MTEDRRDHRPWPLRTALLALLGAGLGLCIDALGQRGPGLGWDFSASSLRASLGVGLMVGGILFGFTLERLRWGWSLSFAILGGVVVAALFHWNGDPVGESVDEGWRLVAALAAVAIAAPLFQTMRDEGRWRFQPGPFHSHAWTNLILWFGAWAFVLATWLLLQLLGSLFQLIGIGLLADALRLGWFNAMVIGAALGAALGLLRDWDGVLALITRLAVRLLALLAPVLALGLVLFVLALPFTGLSTLWEQTRATTPILLACTIGAVLLINAVIGSDDDEEAAHPLLRYSALALGAVLLPLVLIAGYSTAIRIDQHGYTPSRLWAAVVILVTIAVALRYLTSLLRRRAGWAASLRRQNVGLAIGICLVALLLATPLVSFGAISANDQMARLQSGRVSPEEFDWDAMRFDFGRSGIEALRQLREGTDTPDEIRTLAARALSRPSRGEPIGVQPAAPPRERRPDEQLP